MTKRLIDVDDRLLHAAREVLGVETYKDTVNRALERVVTQQPGNVDTASALRAFADATLDLADPEVMSAAWR